MANHEQFRREVDQFLLNHPQSPLSEEQREAFQGLDYYDYDPALVVEAELEPFPEDEAAIRMQTNTGATRWYMRWARATFEVEGQETSLTLYADPDGQGLFVPFKDVTNGEETYGAGRYLDSHRPGLADAGEGRIQIDFNFAYNPYCAYSERYTCPLPPRENWLAVPIRAGEKRFNSG